MYQDNPRPLTYECLLSDPLTRLVMDADGVTVDEFIAVMEAARDARAPRVARFLRPVAARPAAMSVPA